MKNVPHPRISWSGAALLLALGLGGCGTARSNYPNATEQQQRTEAMAGPGAQKTDAVAAESPGTYMNLIVQMQRDGLWFASLAHIDALEQRWGANAESTRLRADALRQTGQRDASRQLYGKLIGTPLEAAGYRGLGLLAGREGDFAQAVQLLEQAQRRNPTDASLLSDLGYAQLRAGHIAQARVPLMQALQLQPDNVQAQANVALYLQASGQPDKAAALMDAHHMPAATRAAIEQTARNLSATMATPAAVPAAIPVATVAATLASAEEDRRPLALKASGWPWQTHLLQASAPASLPAPSASARITTTAVSPPSAPTPPTGAQP